MCDKNRDKPVSCVTKTNSQWTPLLQPSDALSAEDIEYVLEEVRGLLFRGLYQLAREKFNYCFPLSQELSLAERIKIWVDDNKQRHFHTTYLDKELQIVTERDIANRRQILKRMVDGGVLTRGGSVGAFRIIEKGSKLDWLNADDTPLNIVFPLEEERLVEIYPKNTLLYAGSWQSGKTAYFMNMAWMNRDRFSRVIYFMSELGKHEIKKRLRKGKHFDLEEYSQKIEMVEQSSHFQDVLDPDALNFIDYLSVKDNFYEVAGVIEDIDDALKSGVAVIAIQKPGGRDYGYGGEMTGNRPRLYVALERGTAKILKGKNWRTDKSPDGLLRTYKIFDGMRFQPIDDWREDYGQRRYG